MVAVEADRTAVVADITNPSSKSLFPLLLICSAAPLARHLGFFFLAALALYCFQGAALEVSKTNLWPAFSIGSGPFLCLAS